MVALFAARGFFTAVRDSEQALSEEVVQSNRYAAWGLAGRLGSEIHMRWKVLQNEAAASGLRDALMQLQESEGAADQPPLERFVQVQQWLDEVQHRNGDIRTTSWFITDHQGTQLARVPPDRATIGNNYAFRDYFHGQGEQFSEGTQDVQPLRKPHLSNPFRSKSTMNLMVAFSVPILSEDGQQVLGVLAMTAETGNFTYLGSGKSNLTRLSVLVNRRPDDENRRAGLLLEHDHLRHLQNKNEQLPPGKKSPLPAYYLDEGNVAYLDQQSGLGSDGETAQMPVYRDPVGGDVEQFSGTWLAAAEPVVVSVPGRAPYDTGWSVIVQQRPGQAMAPVANLRDTLLRQAVLALAISVCVIGVLWGFVLLMLRGSNRMRWIGRLRRRAGLATQSLPTSSKSARTSKTPSKTDAESG